MDKGSHEVKGKLPWDHGDECSVNVFLHCISAPDFQVLNLVLSGVAQGFEFSFLANFQI